MCLQVQNVQSMGSLHDVRCLEAQLSDIACMRTTPGTLHLAGSLHECLVMLRLPLHAACLHWAAWEGLMQRWSCLGSQKFVDKPRSTGSVGLPEVCCMNIWHSPTMQLLEVDHQRPSRPDAQCPDGLSRVLSVLISLPVSVAWVCICCRQTTTSAHWPLW